MRLCVKKLAAYSVENATGMQGDYKLRDALIAWMPREPQGETGTIGLIDLRFHTSKNPPVFLILRNKSDTHCICIDGCFHTFSFG